MNLHPAQKPEYARSYSILFRTIWTAFLLFLSVAECLAGNLRVSPNGRYFIDTATNPAFLLARKHAVGDLPGIHHR